MGADSDTTLNCGENIYLDINNKLTKYATKLVFEIEALKMKTECF